MKFTVEYPISSNGYDPELVTHAGMSSLVHAIEGNGFDAVAFTEHPAPSLKWLESGGHESLDPVAALAFCAAITERIGLMPYLLVLPYRNPFAAAKALTSIDLLSGGRLTVVAGTGYLRSEFLALGIEMDDRNELFDEAIEVMRGVWSRVPFDHAGKHFSGRNVAQRPMPYTHGGPQFMIGGNSGAARRRAAYLGGWSPLLVEDERFAATTRTAVMSTIEQLGERIAQVRALAIEQRGPAAAVTIQVHTPAAGYLKMAGSVEQHRDHLGRLAEVGVDSFVLQPPGDSVPKLVDGLAEYAATFLSS